MIVCVSHLTVVQALTWMCGRPLLLPDVEHPRGVRPDGGPGRHHPRFPQQLGELCVELTQVTRGGRQLGIVNQQHHAQSQLSQMLCFIVTVSDP